MELYCGAPLGHTVSADVQAFNDGLLRQGPPVGGAIGAVGSKAGQRQRHPQYQGSLAGSISGGANRSALSLDAFRYVSRHRDRTNHLGLALDDRESHLDV